MTDNFELVSSGIRVRSTKGNRISRVNTPVGFTDLAFRNVVAAFDTAYRTLGKLPDVDEVAKLYPSAPKKTISSIMMTDEFKDALSYRGIEWNSDSGLSMEQQMVLLKLSDFTDRRTLFTRLKEMGVPFARYQAWQRQPLFSQAELKLAENNMASSKAMLVNGLLGNAEGGDQRAIELAMKITGYWNPDQQQLEDAKTVVLRVIEAVLKNVTDPKMREAVLLDIRAAGLSYDLVHPAIEG